MHSTCLLGLGRECNCNVSIMAVYSVASDLSSLRSSVYYHSDAEQGHDGIIPYWTYAGSAVQWCGSASGPDPPSGPAFCCGGVSAGLPGPAVQLAVGVNAENLTLSF